MNKRTRKTIKRRIVTPGKLTQKRAVGLMRPRFRTMPVPYGQTGLGHCGCQHGGDFLGIGNALSRTFSNPLRGIAAIGTLGMSEALLQPAELVGNIVGIKPSKALELAAPIIGAVGTATGNPELGMASKGTAAVLDLMGAGRRKKKRVVKKRRTKRKKR